MKSRRAGTALAMVLVAGAVASLLMAAQASTMIARQRAARQAILKTQAQWLAESAFDRARVQQLSMDEPAESWQPDVAESSLPPLQASIQVQTSEHGKTTLVVVARVGREGSPNAAQHTLRQAINNPTGAESP